ncbi:MAG: hypothetical protein PHT54_02310 [Candidatus Nanoarchaeia archaeon]|nr:hypothetical protein [Candidatus Nanoarchaeia archaeon]
MALVEKRYIAQNARSRMVGVMELKEFYKCVKRWLDFEGYSEGKSGGKLFDEEYYKHAFKEGGFVNIDIKWMATKKANPYITYKIELIWLLVAITKVEVIVDGKKLKKDKGDFEIRMTAWIEKDYTKLTKGTPWGFKWMQDLWERFIMKKEVEDHEEELRRKFMNLQKFIRDWMEQHIQSPMG